MTPSHERLVAHLTRLKLVHVRDILDSLLEDAAKRELSYADFLDGVLRAEVQSKQDKRIRMGASSRTSPTNAPSSSSTSARSLRSIPS